MADYRLTAAAQNDIESIWRYTVERWGTERAELYADHLTSVLERLARSPRTASRCDSIRPGYLRGRAGLHMIYFRETDYGIAIIRILHHRMDAGRQLIAT
jgi:toxin ParE1/3/4